MDKENVKHLIYSFLVVINTIIIIQYFKQDYGYAFVNRNHTGYYLSISSVLSIGLILYSKNRIEIIACSLSVLNHFASFVLNHSLGPIVGLIAYFVIATIYYLIKNRKVFIRLVPIILSCVAIFSFFDFTPKVKDLRTEKASIIIQLRDVGLVVLQKTNIIDDETVNDIVGNKNSDNSSTSSGSSNENLGLSAGSDGYERLDMWKVCIDNMLEFPLFGVGVGAWKTYNEGIAYRAPHNEFFELGAIAGIPALILYLALIFYLFIMFRKNIKKQDNLAFIILGAIGCYLVQSLFGNIMPFVSPLFYVMIGLAIKFVDFENILNKNEIVENNDKNEGENLLLEGDNNEE